MRTRNRSEEKAAAEREAANETLAADYDAFRSHLAMAMISDMVGHHAECGFRDCRTAGRCLSLDRLDGVCPIPLDTNLAMMFCGMIWFDNAMEKERDEAREQLLNAKIQQFIAIRVG